MNARSEKIVFESSVRYCGDRIGAAAIYCSDGRYGEQFDDFLHNGLRLPRCDRLALPGGSASLAGHFIAHREEDGTVEHLRFLIRAHDLQRIVLVAHQDCAFYSGRLSLSSLRLEPQQVEDLRAAADRLRGFSRTVAVEAFFARRRADGIVTFEPVQLG